MHPPCFGCACLPACLPTSQLCLHACNTASRNALGLRLVTASNLSGTTYWICTPRTGSLLHPTAAYWVCTASHYCCAALRLLQETIFGMPPGLDGLPQLFSSGHVDEAVPLQAVTRKVVVRFGGGAAAAVADGSGLKSLRHGETEAPMFACSFHYDHVGMMLGAPKA